MRAPGGNFKGDIVWTLQPYIDAEIGWNVDTEDWRRPGADTIASRIMKAKPGSVILMHDGGGDRSQTVEALKKALPQLKQELSLRHDKASSCEVRPARGFEREQMASCGIASGAVSGSLNNRQRPKGD